MSANSLLHQAQRIPLGNWAAYRAHFWLSDEEVLFNQKVVVSLHGLLRERFILWPLSG